MMLWEFTLRISTEVYESWNFCFMSWCVSHLVNVKLSKHLHIAVS